MTEEISFEVHGKTREELRSKANGLAQSFFGVDEFELTGFSASPSVMSDGGSVNSWTANVTARRVGTPQDAIR